MGTVSWAGCQILASILPESARNMIKSFIIALYSCTTHSPSCAFSNKHMFNFHYAFLQVFGATPQYDPHPEDLKEDDPPPKYSAVYTAS